MGRAGKPALFYMAILFDKNADGSIEYFAHDEQTGMSSITTVQDVSGFLDRLAAKRNFDGKSPNKEEFIHYASIPTVVELQLRKKGINIYDKTQTKAVLREINTNYPLLKATYKKHA
jgi:hypothetical protein